jgi:bacteriophage N4 adsorption protein B
VHVLTGKRLTWDKTMHDFPSADGLRSTRQTLGELLVSWQAIDHDQLEHALHDEHAREAPLGRVLMANGWLDEETLAEAVAFQSDLQRAQLSLARLRDAGNQVPLDVLIQLRALPQGIDENGHAVFVAANLLSDEALDELHALTGRPVTLRIVRESEIAAGLRILRQVDDPLLADGETVRSPLDSGASRGVPLLGDLLIELGAVTRTSFEAARNVISPQALQSAMAAQQRLRDAQAEAQ